MPTSSTTLYKVIVEVKVLYAWSPYAYLTPVGGKSGKVAAFANSGWSPGDDECDDKISLRQ